MIPIVDVWKSVQETAKKSTSGYQTKDKFNNDVELVQISILRLLCELYEKEQVISDELAYHVVTLNQIPENKPEDYHRFVAAEINNEEVYPLHRSSVPMTKSSSVRGSVKCFYFDSNKIKFLLGKDEEIKNGFFTYIKRPNKAEINITYSEDGGDYQTPVKVSDIDWPYSLRPLFEAMLLERLGIETRELISIEFGRLGIDRETSNYK